MGDILTPDQQDDAPATTRACRGRRPASGNAPQAGRTGDGGGVMAHGCDRLFSPRFGR